MAAGKTAMQVQHAVAAATPCDERGIPRDTSTTVTLGRIQAMKRRQNPSDLDPSKRSLVELIAKFSSTNRQSKSGIVEATFGHLGVPGVIISMLVSEGTIETFVDACMNNPSRVVFLVIDGKWKIGFSSDTQVFNIVCSLPSLSGEIQSKGRLFGVEI